MQADLKLQRSNVRAVAAGLPPTYVYRHVYCPRQGLFRALRRDQLRLGQWIDPQEAQQLMSGAGGGEVSYGVGGRGAERLRWWGAYRRMCACMPSTRSQGLLA